MTDTVEDKAILMEATMAMGCDAVELFSRKAARAMGAFYCSPQPMREAVVALWPTVFELHTWLLRRGARRPRQGSEGCEFLWGGSYVRVLPVCRWRGTVVRQVRDRPADEVLMVIYGNPQFGTKEVGEGDWWVRWTFTMQNHDAWTPDVTVHIQRPLYPPVPESFLRDYLGLVPHSGPLGEIAWSCP